MNPATTQRSADERASESMPSTPIRSFPFRPAAPRACARTSLVAGVLPWRGQAPPTRGDVAGLAATAQGLVRIELFADGGLRVVDHAEVVSTGLPSNFRDMQVGTVHTVWEWKVAIEQAQAAT